MLDKLKKNLIIIAVVALLWDVLKLAYGVQPPAGALLIWMVAYCALDGFVWLCCRARGA